jgi:hypothetical protein
MHYIINLMLFVGPVNILCFSINWSMSSISQEMLSNKREYTIYTYKWPMYLYRPCLV